MSLKLDNSIKGCTPKDGVVSKAVAYCYQPFTPGVVNPNAPDASLNSIEINGTMVERSPDRPVLLYKSGDKSGEWELLADVSEEYFRQSFDFNE
jgi:hypothetical protein